MNQSHEWVLILFVSWNNLLECLNPTEEPLYCTTLLVEFRIEPERPPTFRMFPESPVDRDIALDPSFPVVLTDLPCIIGCICGDEHGANLHFRNLKHFESRLIKPGIMDICRKNCADEQMAVPIDQSTQFVSVYPFIAIIAC